MEKGEERADPPEPPHKAPASALAEEPLLPLPAIPYQAISAWSRPSIGKTAFVEFDTNRYSVPTDYAGMAAAIFAYADHVEIMVNDRKIAHHAEVLRQIPEDRASLPPGKLLERTPHGKYERIYHLMKRMGKEIDDFLAVAESVGEDRLRVAHGLFRLLRTSSKEMLLSAVREAQTPSTSISSDTSRASSDPRGRKRRPSIRRTHPCWISLTEKGADRL